MTHGIAPDIMVRMNRDARARLRREIMGVAIATVDGEDFARRVMATEEFRRGRRQETGRNDQDQRQKTQEEAVFPHIFQPYACRHKC